LGYETRRSPGCFCRAFLFEVLNAWRWDSSPCLHSRVSYPTGSPLNSRESDKPAGKHRENVQGEDRGALHYLCAILDGASRYLVDWSLRESMREPDVEILLQRAKERFPDARPRIISDNGPQFIAQDFKEFIRISGMTHVRTSPYYPQSNGKMERWNGSIKSECIRPGVPLSLEDAIGLVEQYVQVYNEQRLHSAIGYIAPKAMLEGRRKQIHAERDRKLEAARRQREQAARNRRASKEEPQLSR